MRRVIETREFTEEDLDAVREQVYEIYSVLIASSMALYHIQDEKDPVNKATIISFALDRAAKDLVKLHDSL